ncbi:MAG: hypothetical protein ACTSVU_09900 [Promethearchaeota archaeon]
MQFENFITGAIDLERSELRYIFYINDQNALIRDLEKIGFKQHNFPETPYTRTIYFGSEVGLRTGLSIKARSYSDRGISDICEINEDSEFNLLEIKTTVSQEDFDVQGLMEDNSTSKIADFNQIIEKGVLYRIQRMSEDGILQDSTLKSKNRLMKHDFTPNYTKNQLNLREITEILTKDTPSNAKFSEKLLTILNNKIRPYYHESLHPYFMTQYKRMHFIPKDEQLQKTIRITVDPGVEYYDMINYRNRPFLEHLNMQAEKIYQERFCRLEFKLDPFQLKRNHELDNGIREILRKYGCIAFVSKKWSGVSKISEVHIDQQDLWQEPLDVRISGFFPVHKSWYNFESINRSLSKIISHSQTFTFLNPIPKILVKNVNFVNGKMGFPTTSLVVMVEGPKIEYKLPRRSYPIEFSSDKPEFYIVEEKINPVRSVFITSYEEIAHVLHPSIKIQSHAYFRSFGFLIINKKSNRAYKLTIERKTLIKSNNIESIFYCKMRYLGSKNRLYTPNKHEIISELSNFYEEFAPYMNQSLETYENLKNE